MPLPNKNMRVRAYVLIFIARVRAIYIHSYPLSPARK